MHSTGLQLRWLCFKYHPVHGVYNIKIFVLYIVHNDNYYVLYDCKWKTSLSYYISHQKQNDFQMNNLYDLVTIF